MALRVSYTNRIGYYTKTEKWPDEPDRKFKNWMCHANVDLWADMYFYKVSEDHEEFGEKLKEVEKEILALPVHGSMNFKIRDDKDSHGVIIRLA